jgi:UDP-N-acetylglucosamine 2-epimerase (non-hydrolysing)
MVGNILMDTLRFNHDRLRRPAIDVEEGRYFVFTLNRKVLLNDEPMLLQMLSAMVKAAGDAPIVAPLRGLASEKVSRLLSQLPHADSLMLVPPLSYLEFGWLTAHAQGIITDSGNVAEEATFNGVPCITLNDYTEHQETVTIGSNVLVGGDSNKLVEALSIIKKGEWKKCALPDRWDGRTAERIVQILLSSH